MPRSMFQKDDIIFINYRSWFETKRWPAKVVSVYVGDNSHLIYFVMLYQKNVIIPIEGSKAFHPAKHGRITVNETDSLELIQAITEMNRDKALNSKRHHPITYEKPTIPIFKTVSPEIVMYFLEPMVKSKDRSNPSEWIRPWGEHYRPSGVRELCNEIWKVISPKFQIGDVVLVAIRRNYPQRCKWPAKVTVLCYADTGDYVYGIKLYGLETHISVRDETKIFPIKSGYLAELDLHLCSAELLNAINKMNKDLINNAMNPLQPRQLNFVEEEEEEEVGWMTRAYNSVGQIWKAVRGFIEWLRRWN